MDRRKALRNTAFLTGAIAGTPSLLSLLQACQEQPRLSWQPTFLSVDQAQFISNFVDVILPKTSTPGALDVKVDIFIDLVYAKTFDKQAQENVVQEIEKFNQDCAEQQGDTFVALSKEKQIEVLKLAEKATAKFNKGVWGTAVGEQKPVGFYRQLKSMAMWAYFTSEEVGEKILNYDPIPGDYKGCIPHSEVGNNWSL